jgi:hypothetical protein
MITGARPAHEDPADRSVLQEAVDAGHFLADVSVRLLRDLIFGAIEHQTWAYLRGEGDFDVDEAARGITTVIYRSMAAERPD